MRLCLVILWAAASGERSGPVFSSIDLQVAWSAALVVAPDMTIARAAATRSRLGSIPPEFHQKRRICYEFMNPVLLYRNTYQMKKVK